MDKLAERPPYVVFEMRSVEDRAATLAADDGLPKMRDVPFAIITPPGSKDQIERNAEDWFAEKRTHVQSGRWPAAWHQAFKEAFEAWKKDEEPPVNGMSIREWNLLTKTQFESLRAIRVMTVEDVAAMNEEAIARLGMGGRALKQKAVEFLQTAKDIGASAGRIAAMQAELDTLKATTESQALVIAQLKAAQSTK